LLHEKINKILSFQADLRCLEQLTDQSNCSLLLNLYKVDLVEIGRDRPKAESDKSSRKQGKENFC
jgi:hypothetical protein